MVSHESKPNPILLPNSTGQNDKSMSCEGEIEIEDEQARCGESPSFHLQAIHDHIPSAASHESMPHPLAKLPPNSAGQNNETMPYEWEIDLEDVMDHDGIQVSNPDQIMSSSVLLPQTISTDRDHISLVTTLELDPLSPTVPLPTVLSETDANMSSSMESLPLAAINLAPLDHTPSKAPTYKLTPVPLTIPLPKESNGAAASGQNSEGWMDGTEDGTAVSAEPGRMHTLIYSGLPIPLSS